MIIQKLCVMKLYVMDIGSLKMTNTIAIKRTKNCHSKKVWDFYFLDTVLLVVILILIKALICYHYVIQRDIDALTR